MRRALLGDALDMAVWLTVLAVCADLGILVLVWVRGWLSRDKDGTRA